MRTYLRYALFALVAGLVVVQFFPADLPPQEPRPTTDLLGTQEVPEPIVSILKTSCYDCHSVETRYPWYSKVAPVSWLVAKDVREGREEMNLSEWTDLAKRKKIKNLENIKDEVTEGHMPMPIYLVIHWDARLTDEQRKQIADWADSYQDQILNTPDPEEEEEEE
ncbi:MAG: heme-binding domain-containing protein, partial [Cyclobacteriaceae bacterium]|nr:heme-binding domain-containing protein [Cyclobacteriaceae bacterium]